MHEGIHHVTYTPDADTDAYVAVFSSREGVAALRVSDVIHVLFQVTSAW